MVIGSKWLLKGLDHCDATLPSYRMGAICLILV